MGDSNPRPHQCECIALSPVRLLKMLDILMFLEVRFMVLLLAIYYAPTREKMQYQNAYILYIFSQNLWKTFYIVCPILYLFSRSLSTT